MFNEVVCFVVYRGGIHLTEEGPQKLTSAMAEVHNDPSIMVSVFP